MAGSVRWDLIADPSRFNRGFQAAERTSKGFTSRFGKGIKSLVETATGPLGLAAVAAGAGAVAVSSVKSAATFDRTLRQMAAVADVPAKGLQALSKLALKMGADTSFSAQEAADAMLELAKGGLTEAQIKAGGLQATLTLAAAGSLDLATAAGTMANALNMFSLGADKAGSVAAALAGGANASTASVESLAEALSQVGPGARNAGLNLNDTVGVLAAFDQAGIKGSDAGTSLKTALAALVPQTSRASTAMHKLGLDFTDAHGSILPITDIAQQLQDKLGKLSEAQRISALSTIFGSDATRAATVLMREGSKGIGDYIKATTDQKAAQDLANASMQGTAGALEQMSGSIDTAKIALGTALAPAAVAVAHGITNIANAASDWIQNHQKQFVDAFQTVNRWWNDNKDTLGELAAALRDTFTPAASMATDKVNGFSTAADNLSRKLDGVALFAANLVKWWIDTRIQTTELMSATYSLITALGHGVNALDRITGGAGHAGDALVHFGEAGKRVAESDLAKLRGAADRTQAAIDRMHGKRLEFEADDRLSRVIDGIVNRLRNIPGHVSVGFGAIGRPGRPQAFQHGTERVPHTQLALVHAGEIILDPARSELIRTGRAMLGRAGAAALGGAGGMGGVTVNVNVTGSLVGSSPRQLATALVPHVRSGIRSAQRHDGIPAAQQLR